MQGDDQRNQKNIDARPINREEAKRVLEKHYEGRLPSDPKEFTFDSRKPEGNLIKDGNFSKNANQKKFMIKYLNENPSGDDIYYNHHNIREFIAADLFKLLLHDNAVSIGLIKRDQSAKKSAIRSAFIEDSLPLAKYLDNENVGLLEGFEKVIAACLILGDEDFHGGNLMVQSVEEETDKIARRIVKIDHGLAFFCFHNSYEKYLEYLSDRFFMSGYTGSIRNSSLQFNLTKFIQSLEQMLSQITVEQIDNIFATKIAILKQEGINLKIYEKDLESARESLKKNLAIMAQVRNNLAIMAKFSNVSDKFKNGEWFDILKDSQYKDFVVYAFVNNILIENKNSITWALENKRQDKVNVALEWALSIYLNNNKVNTELGDKAVDIIDKILTHDHEIELILGTAGKWTINNQPILMWFIQNNIKINDMHPVTWALKNKSKIEDLSIGEWYIANKNNVEFENKLPLEEEITDLVAMEWASGKPILLPKWYKDINANIEARNKNIVQKALDNKIIVRNKNLILWCIKNNHPIDGKNALLYSMTFNMQIKGLLPLEWYEQKKANKEYENKLPKVSEILELIISDVNIYSVIDKARDQSAKDIYDELLDKWNNILLDAIKTNTKAEGHNPVDWYMRNRDNPILNAKLPSLSVVAMIVANNKFVIEGEDLLIKAFLESYKIESYADRMMSFVRIIEQQQEGRLFSCRKLITCWMNLEDRLDNQTILDYLVSYPEPVKLLMKELLSEYTSDPTSDKGKNAAKMRDTMVEAMGRKSTRAKLSDNNIALLKKLSSYKSIAFSKSGNGLEDAKSANNALTKIQIKEIVESLEVNPTEVVTILCDISRATNDTGSNTSTHDLLTDLVQKCATETKNIKNSDDLVNNLLGVAKSLHSQQEIEKAMVGKIVGQDSNISSKWLSSTSLYYGIGIISIIGISVMLSYSVPVKNWIKGIADLCKDNTR